jgi:Na+-transporting NADH:ubiquinone oxidoreductase subunit NqrD
MSTRSTAAVLLRALRPDESLPYRRIARFALYGLAVLAVGFVAELVVVGLLELVGDVVLLGILDGLWFRTVRLVDDAITAFSVLFALGVVLTQVEE